MKKIILIIASFLIIGILAFGGYIYYQINSMNKMARGALITKDFVKEIPFKRNDGHIVIEATINGQKGLFYFDSGAGNILFKNRIKTDSFDKIGNLSSTDASGKKMEMDLVTIPSLKIANVEFQDLSFRLIDEFDFQCTDGIVGIIGYSAMRHANWQVDYENQIITFSDKLDKLDVKGDKVALKINKFTFEPEVALHVNDTTPVYFTFDTGNAGGILADKETFEQIKFQNKFLFSGGKATGLSGKNKKEFRDSTVYKLSDQLKLGTIKFDPTIIDYETPKALNLLGNKVLENYLVTISWSENAVWLKKIRTSKPSLFNFQYHKMGDKWLITAIEKNLRSRFNVQPGDEILEINGVTVNKQNRCTTFPENTIFTIQTQSKKDIVNLKLVNLINK
jgi:hypothetical protein